ncbi:MAG: hypothetical protein ACOCV2_14705 [Persicimonas sp.]
MGGQLTNRFVGQVNPVRGVGIARRIDLSKRRLYIRNVQSDR